MKKILILSITLIALLAIAIIDKINHPQKTRTPSQISDSESKKITPIIHIDDKRKQIIQTYLGEMPISDISKPLLYNLQKPEYGLDKGDLVEFVSVIYLDNQQPKTAVFSFQGSRLLTVKK